jgi:hypothetical protein
MSDNQNHSGHLKAGIRARSLVWLIALVPVVLANLGLGFYALHSVDADLRSTGAELAHGLTTAFADSRTAADETWQAVNQCGQANPACEIELARWLQRKLLAAESVRGLVVLDHGQVRFNSLGPEWGGVLTQLRSLKASAAGESSLMLTQRGAIVRVTYRGNLVASLTGATWWLPQ